VLHAALRDAVACAWRVAAALWCRDMANNLMRGSPPDTLGNFTQLTHLDLSNNQLQGSIPETLGDLKQLAVLDMSNNLGGYGIVGSIPETLMGLKQLVTLDLQHNRIEGSIPKMLGGLQQLTYLDLSDNRLQGSIPETLGGLKQLVFLDLQQNLIEGSIPKTLGRLQQLVYLLLSNNRLEGSIPETLGHLKQLDSLYLWGNRLTGVVPSLPFENYPGNCNLQLPTSPSNHFTCPSPPVSPPRVQQNSPSRDGLLVCAAPARVGRLPSMADLQQLADSTPRLSRRPRACHSCCARAPRLYCCVLTPAPHSPLVPLPPPSLSPPPRFSTTPLPATRTLRCASRARPRVFQLLLPAPAPPRSSQSPSQSVSQSSLPVSPAQSFGESGRRCPASEGGGAGGRAAAAICCSRCWKIRICSSKSSRQNASHPAVGTTR
jgi:hypothetical protein